MFIGEVVVGDKKHPQGSTIAFEFKDDLYKGISLAYKPMELYKR